MVRHGRPSLTATIDHRSPSWFAVVDRWSTTVDRWSGGAKEPTSVVGSVCDVVKEIAFDVVNEKASDALKNKAANVKKKSVGKGKKSTVDKPKDNVPNPKDNKFNAHSDVVLVAKKPKPNPKQKEKSTVQELSEVFILRNKKLKGKSKKEDSDFELETDVVDSSSDEVDRKRKKLKIKAGLKRKRSGSDSLDSSSIDMIKKGKKKMTKKIKKEEFDEESVPKKGVPVGGYSLFNMDEREADHEFVKLWVGQFHPVELKDLRVNDIAQKLVAAKEIDIFFKVNFHTGFAAVLAVLKPKRLKADRARMYEEAGKVESCPSEIILDDLLALDSIGSITEFVYLVEAHHHLNPIFIPKDNSPRRLDDGVVMLVLEARSRPLRFGEVHMSLVALNPKLEVFYTLSYNQLSGLLVDGCSENLLVFRDGQCRSAALATVSQIFQIFVKEEVRLDCNLTSQEFVAFFHLVSKMNHIRMKYFDYLISWSFQVLWFKLSNSSSLAKPVHKGGTSDDRIDQAGSGVAGRSSSKGFHHPCLKFTIGIYALLMSSSFDNCACSSGPIASSNGGNRLCGAWCRRAYGWTVLIGGCSGGGGGGVTWDLEVLGAPDVSDGPAGGGGGGG
nr:hypothetical protein [Tanacetum cinerariifolium]